MIKKIDILFLDFMIPYGVTTKVFEQILNIYSLDINNKLRILLQDEHNTLSISFKSHIERGEVIPTYLINSFVTTELKNVLEDRVLLTNYPQNKEHFKSLSEYFERENLSIHRCWYIKQKNHSEYLNQYIIDNKNWCEKYGENVITKWKESFELKKERINEIKKSSNFSNWIDLEVNFENIEQNLIRHLKDFS